ncbi:MAG: hypothetical protein JWR61_2832 [Ferruginibacter sp.]|nr:hypothetical protein [Ferruginibacter sp.]
MVITGRMIKNYRNNATERHIFYGVSLDKVL